MDYYYISMKYKNGRTEYIGLSTKYLGRYELHDNYSEATKFYTLSLALETFEYLKSKFNILGGVMMLNSYNKKVKKNQEF